MSKRVKDAPFAQVPFTPRMRDGLAALLGGGDLAFERTPVGRPSKQRLAKYGLARYLPRYLPGNRVALPVDWDGPMEITDRGRRFAASKGVQPQPPQEKCPYESCTFRGSEEQVDEHRVTHVHDDESQEGSNLEGGS